MFIKCSPVADFVKVAKALLPLHDEVIRNAVSDSGVSDEELGKLLRRNRSAHQALESFKRNSKHDITVPSRQLYEDVCSHASTTGAWNMKLENYRIALVNTYGLA